ncbi:MAG: HAMP domain-containing histidine kinase, partial [Clostridia bacterium]|nr:HAMP domain-containing histidine kinase [Clostridia bacterium]
MPAPTERNGQIFPANCTTALTDFLSTYDASRTNLRFRVWLDDTVILSNDAAWDDALSFSFYAEAPIVNDLKNTGHTIRIECGLLSGCPIQDDYSAVYQAWQRDAAHWEWWILAAVVTAVLSIVFLVCVLFQPGMRYSTQSLHLTAIDRLPVEPVLAVWGVVLTVVLLLIPELDFYLDQSLLLLFGYLHGNLREWFPALALAALSIAAVLLALSILCGCVRRIRAGTWWKNTLCYRILHILLCAVTYLLRAAGRMISKAGTNFSLFWRWMAGCSAFGLWTFIAMLSRTPILWGIWIVTAVVLGLALCLYMLEWDIIRKNTEKVAMGDLTHHTETARLHGAPKVVGKDLNRIGDAISLAVEDRMKSERFRSELITNVSHDLKTPLTSIINYTDLLSKEDCENETMRGYIDVLSRQAYRLKKLTEDLLEVSKASAQTLPVVLDTTDAAELLQQAIGEYESRLAAAGLHPVLSISENPLFILADGKHLWRVFDNLLSNICKYSLPGTRVYLSAQMASDTVLLTFRNISAAPIAVSANELTERFVRGDASRHTEGSGLGLAIADSLCRLQNGSLEISVDGDLFKVVVAFHAIDTPTSS